MLMVVDLHTFLHFDRCTSLKRIIRAMVVFVMFGLVLTMDSFGQNATEGGDKNKKAFDEWKEIFKLRSEFVKNQYGSRYVLGIFDGRFIGPNDEDNYGIRSYTTSYDYLIFGNSLLATLINFGFTADKIDFLTSKNVPDHHPYPLGCIGHYMITQSKTWVDSSYNANVGKNVAVDKPFKSSIAHLGIDSVQVHADLAGFCLKRKEENTSGYDTIILPQIEGSGSWKDANNFDMAYEWFETFFLKYCDSIDISKRQFSKKTPLEIQQCILQRYNTKKYLQENNLTEKDLTCKLLDRYKNDAFDLLHQQNEVVLRMGNYELFRYFNNVYWRDINEGVVMVGRGKNDAGELVDYSYVWKPGDRKNSVWHCAFQYDKDRETNPHSGLINYIMLPYGTKGRNMPTVVPNDIPPFSQFEGVVIYTEGCEKQGYSNKDDIWLNTINGRMVNRSFFCYNYEVGILPLNDDGTVDGIYRIFVWKDNKEYWAYIYCGKHAGVRGGKPGKSFVDQVDNFRKNYNFSDYWYFYKEVDYTKNVTDNMPIFIGKLESLEKHEKGIDGKTRPKIKIPIVIPNANNPKKPTINNFFVVLNGDHTGTILPRKLNFVWEIEIWDDYTNNILVKRKSVILNIGGKKISLDKMDEYLKKTEFSGSDVRKANDEFEKNVANANVKEPVENYNELYNSHVYNLQNSDETQSLIDAVKEELAAVRYEMPKAERTLEISQDENSDKIAQLKKQMDALVADKKTKKPIYQETKDEYDKLKEIVDKKLFHYNKLLARETYLIELLGRCNERLDINLNNDLAMAESRIAFLGGERKKYADQLEKLKSEGKTSGDNVQQIKISITNKEQELKQAEEKKKKIEVLIANQRKLQSEQ